MEFYNQFWKKEYQIDKNISLKGYSRGSQRTGFVLLPYKIFLDCGVPFPIEPNLILITHGHQDHIDALYTNLMDNRNKAQVICSYNLVKLLQEHLNACRSVNVGRKIKFNNWEPYSINTNNNFYRTLICGKTFIFNSIQLDHEVETYGYGISEVRNKLLEIYKDKTQDELIEIKKITNITEEKIYPIIFFCGDTSQKSLEYLPFDDYPIFIIESTFFDLEHIVDADTKKHMHINYLIPYFEKHINTKFILIHFSCKYKLEEIKNYQQQYKIYTNVIFWI
jgi:ribonuclease BN (tRNA processing enzyme)